jgi:hypothetical protein
MKVVTKSAAALAGAIALAFIAADTAPRSLAQPRPCNPAIDGTYCAEAGGGGAPGSPSDARRAISDLSLGGALGGALYDKPATLGAITFGIDGSRCIGLIRRLSCTGG